MTKPLTDGLTRKLTVSLVLSMLLLGGAGVSAHPMLTLRGTIAGYDPSTHTLSLVAAVGPVKVRLAPTTRVGRRGRTLDASALTTLSGYRAAVRYEETGGAKIAESVQVLGKEPKDTGQLRPRSTNAGPASGPAGQLKS